MTIVLCELSLCYVCYCRQPSWTFTVADMFSHWKNNRIMSETLAMWFGKISKLTIALPIVNVTTLCSKIKQQSLRARELACWKTHLDPFISSKQSFSHLIADYFSWNTTLIFAHISVIMYLNCVLISDPRSVAISKVILEKPPHSLHQLRFPSLPRLMDLLQTVSNKSSFSGSLSSLRQQKFDLVITCAQALCSKLFVYCIH